MYTDFFGLNEKPFSITPDPRYLYMTRRHADALAHLIYGIKESGGFVQLTGEVGTGKTTLIRSLLEQLPEKVRIAVILNPNLNSLEFLRAICQELHILVPPDPSKSDLIGALNRFLLRAHSEGTRVVLIVDEAQTLDVEVLEQVRLLTNLETTRQKLLQIILIGQPELRDVLERSDMRQLAQRVTGRYHLEPLDHSETAAYVKHRMQVAGAHGEVFTASAIRQLYRRSSGVPRLINVVADRALLAAYSTDSPKIDGRLVRRAAAEVFGQPKRRWASFATMIAVLVVLVAASTRLAPGDDETTRAARAPDEAAAESAPEPDLLALETAQPPALLRLPAPKAGVDEGALAFAALFAAWELDYDGETAGACAQARTNGLRCLRIADGSIRQLRALARPTILSLVDESGSPREAVLTGLGYEDAEIVIGGERLVLSVADLTRYWNGIHTLFWRPRVANGETLRPGMQGEAVSWLRDSLAGLLGNSGQPELGDAAGEAPTLYDAELERLVREYQQERWLEADGIAGAQTQIALASELEVPGIPILDGRQ